MHGVTLISVISTHTPPLSTYSCTHTSPLTVLGFPSSDTSRPALPPLHISRHLPSHPAQPHPAAVRLALHAHLAADRLALSRTHPALPCCTHTPAVYRLTLRRRAARPRWSSDCAANVLHGNVLYTKTRCPLLSVATR